MFDRVYNFSAGPSVMPEAALIRARKDLLNYEGSGMSVMEMSHRTPVFAEIFESTRQKLRKTLSIPDSHEILFLQGGATLQFASIPMNLSRGGKADYAITGNFANKAAREAEKYCTVHVAATTANNTIYGTEWHYVPETPAPLVCDMSSDILSQPVDVARYGLIYAGAQKNMAPAGLTVVIIERSLAGQELSITPQIMSYAENIKADSMPNTPPCWCIYMLGLTLDWLESVGGVTGMQQVKRERARRVYEMLDNSSFYHAHAQREARSDMNVTFRTASPELDAAFVKEAAARGLVNLKGHRMTGGMRASLYNAMPMEGVDALVTFMKEFEKEHV